MSSTSVQSFSPLVNFRETNERGRVESTHGPTTYSYSKCVLLELTVAAGPSGPRADNIKVFRAGVCVAYSAVWQVSLYDRLNLIAPKETL